MSSASTLFRRVVPALLAVALLSATSVRAAPPDFGRYCLTKHGFSLIPNVPGETPLACLDPKSRATSSDKVKATPIDMAVACRETNGSEEFRYIDERKIDCSRNPRPTTAPGEGVYILWSKDIAKYCSDWYGPGTRGGYSASLGRTVCTGGSLSSPQTVNYMLLCRYEHKTDKVRYVHDPDRKRYYVACVR
jgi:hypothetical protein